MKRSELRNIIKGAVARRLHESFSKTDSTHKKLSEVSTTKRGAKFSYKLNEGTNPDIVLIGYGKTKVNTLKNNIARELEEMAKCIRESKTGAKDVIDRWGNELGYKLYGLNEVQMDVAGNIDVPVSEVTPPQGIQTQPTDAPALNQQDNLKIQKLEADKAKDQQELEKTKGELAKKTKPYTDKINKLEKKIGDTYTAIERIKK
jgi:hypothetical protein